MNLRQNISTNIRIFIICLLTISSVIFQTLTVRTVRAEKISNNQNDQVEMMTLEGFIKEVVKKNENILSQYLDFQISHEAVKIEKSVFEPEFLSEYQRGEQRVQDEQSPLLFGSKTRIDLHEVNENYTTAIKSRVPTGATVQLGYNIEASRDLTLNEQEQFRSFMGLELSQPLLKGSGMAATANIDVAEANLDVSFQDYRRKMLQVVLNAAATCWDYYVAREKLYIRKDSVKIAEQILTDNQERARLGKMAQTEILEAEAGLAKRKSLEIKARQDLISAINTLRSYISSQDVETRLGIEFGEHLTGNDVKPDFDSSIKKAFSFRPEYLSAKRKIEKENIVVSYAKNQRWPQLDLKGSYGLNGLGDTIGDSWNDMHNGDYKTWSVGASLTVPIFGGGKTKGELTSAKYRQKQALLELKSVEVEVANMVSTSIQNVSNTNEQLSYYNNVRNLNQRLLDVEMAMLEAGKSNSRSVLEKEEDLIEAKESELESFVDHKKAILVLETTEGVLLHKYDVEVMKGGK